MQPDRAGEAAAEQSEQREQQLLLALAFQSGQADHLARAQRKADPVQASGQAEVAYLEQSVVGMRRRWPHPFERVLALAEHHLECPRRLEAGARHAADMLAAAQHGHSVGKRGDFLHPVRDEDNRAAARLQPMDHLHQALDVAAPKGRGRLVEDQHARFE